MLSLPFQENQENATNLVISDTELKQVAYVFKCTNSTLQIKGKINSITLGKWRNPENCFCMLVCLQKAESPEPYCELLCLAFADNCKKLGLVFDDVVGIVEIINSRDVKVQVSVCNFSAWSMTDALYNRASVASASLRSFISRTGMHLWRTLMKRHLSYCSAARSAQPLGKG